MKAKDVVAGMVLPNGEYIESVESLANGLILVNSLVIDNDCGEENGFSIEYHPEEEIDPPAEDEDYPGLFHGNHYD